MRRLNKVPRIVISWNHYLRLSTKTKNDNLVERQTRNDTLLNIVYTSDQLPSIDDYSPSPVRVRVKKNVSSLGFVEHWKKRRSVYVQEEKTNWDWLQDSSMLEMDIGNYQEGFYQELEVPLERRINYKKQSFERDISLLAVRWFQRRRGTELKRQFYRHRHTVYASCCLGQDLKREWLERLNIPESAFERLSLEEKKDWFSSEVCRRLFTKRYSVQLATQHANILARRLRLEVAKLGNIVVSSHHNRMFNSATEKRALEYGGVDMFGIGKVSHDIVILDDSFFSDNDLYSILEFAIRSVADYGLLCLHVNLPKLSEEWQSIPFAPEFQLRRFLDQLVKSAFVHKVYVEPVFSCVLEGARAHIWLRVRKDLYGQIGWTRRSGLLYYCPHCYSYRTQPLEWTPSERQDGYGRNKGSKLCEYCGTSSWYFGGSVYLESLCHTRESSRILHELIVPVSRSLNGRKATLTLANAADMEILFSAMAAESRCSPFFLDIEKMNELFQIPSPGKELVYIALKSRGYEAFPSHTSLHGLKTNAPLDVVWDVWKSWKLYCEPNSNHCLLSYKPLLYFHSQEWEQWLSSSHTVPLLAISQDERFFRRLHHSKERMQTKLVPTLRNKPCQ
ncbi:hypothetical protein GpartN1_g7285.t1 [Galdieria partita]|uniref:tRNA (guanine(26)-N(2))-dimethyltransferase n=1 Tax=Galdieria partita TaxID=83374 RepID=A0A9C7Q387_9RHOD|nr:hypothetical protein GpartN1_g7285.t1 [Galdieria partita]